MATKRRRPQGSGSLHKLNGSGNWIARWHDQNNKRQERSTRTSDKATAERILAKHVSDALLRKEGIIDARTDQYADAEQRPLSGHLDDWRASLLDRGITHKQTGMLLARATKLFNSAGANRLSDISPIRIQSAIAELKANNKSLRTCHHYLRSAKQFSRWLNKHNLNREDALAHLTVKNVATDRRHERRPLDADELRYLIRVTETAETWRGLSGTDRAMLYRAATGTGFRASELRSLTPRSFRLHDDTPGVVLRAGSSKRRTEDYQPIRSDLADTLGPWMENHKADQPLWPGRWNEKGAMMLRRDLRLARARWIKASTNRVERCKRNRGGFLAATDDDGCVVDFHALRMTYITALARGGASVKAAQQLARHSDPKLTMNIYTSLGIHDLSSALDGLPDLDDDQPQVERLRATGTYDGSAENHSASHRLNSHLTARENVQSAATGCSNDAESHRARDSRKSLGIKGKRGNNRGEKRLRHAGLEPATFGSVNRCSIQLS